MPYQADKTHLFRMSELQATVIVEALRYSLNTSETEALLSNDPVATELAAKMAAALQIAQTAGNTQQDTVWELL